jgi:hypothetical protein
MMTETVVATIESDTDFISTYLEEEVVVGSPKTQSRSVSTCVHGMAIMSRTKVLADRCHGVTAPK